MSEKKVDWELVIFAVFMIIACLILFATTMFSSSLFAINKQILKTIISYLPFILYFILFPMLYCKLIGKFDCALPIKVDTIGALIFGFIIIIYFLFGNVEKLDTRSWLIYILCGVVVAISEEYTYRHVLINLLSESKLKMIYVILISAFLFAFVNHSASSLWDNLLIKFPTSCLLGYLALKKGDITYCVLIHFCYNALMDFI